MITSPWGFDIQKKVPDVFVGKVCNRTKDEAAFNIIVGAKFTLLFLRLVANDSLRAGDRLGLPDAE
jgi:hypothetical protein